MQRLLQCMAVPQAAEAAAIAFRNLCVRCTGQLQGSSVLGALIHAVQGLLSQGSALPCRKEKLTSLSHHSMAPMGIQTNKRLLSGIATMLHAACIGH